MYKIVWNNGFWKVRNQWRFEDVAIFGTKREAEASFYANTTAEQRDGEHL